MHLITISKREGSVGILCSYKAKFVSKKETLHENLALLNNFVLVSNTFRANMRGYILLFACLLAVVMCVTLIEGKPIEVADHKHESEDNADEPEEQNVEELSGSGSGSGAGIFGSQILQ